jgi:hypothetical protein
VVALVVLLVAEFCPRHSNRNAGLAAHWIVWGGGRSLFWGGVVTLGLALPTCSLAGIIQDQTPTPAALWLAVGVAVRNHLLVQAPQRVPLS